MSYSLNSAPATTHHFSHVVSDADEAQYDSLRALARSEHGKRADLSQRSQAAYRSGDKAEARELSQQAKQHAAAADRYNTQARDFIFRVNNAHREEGVIDLHGLYVEEAEEILERRVEAEKRRGADMLEVIVGKGLHSEGRVLRLGRAVEDVVARSGTRWRVDPENSGRGWIVFSEGVYAQHHEPPQEHHRLPQQHYDPPQEHRWSPQQQHGPPPQHYDPPQEHRWSPQQQHGPPPQQQWASYDGGLHEQQQQQPSQTGQTAEAFGEKIVEKLSKCCVM